MAADVEDEEMAGAEDTSGSVPTAADGAQEDEDSDAGSEDLEAESSGSEDDEAEEEGEADGDEDMEMGDHSESKHAEPVGDGQHISQQPQGEVTVH